MKRLIQIFQPKYLTAVCIIFAIANRIIFTTLYSQIGSDTKIQLTFAQNLLAGKGMGVTKYFTNDLNTPIFDTHQWFPPGFSIAILPFLKLSGGDEFKAVLVFDLLTAILFVVAVRVLGKHAGLPAYLNNIVTLIIGCSQYIFFMDWASTDAISLCFLLFALAKTIDVISQKANLTVLQTFSYGILFCLPFFFRYMYLPLAVLMPSFVLLFGFVSKNRELKAGGCKLLVSCGFLLSLFFVFNLFTAGNALYVHNVGRGFYFSQLLRWYPFFPASFINLDFAAQSIERISRVEYSRIMFFFRIINIVHFVLFLVLLMRFLYTDKTKMPFSRHFIFIIIGSAISITIILLLAYLSITYKELTWGLTKWTHVQDARYFSYIYIFIPLLFFIGLHYYASFFRRSFIRIFVFIALCFFGTEILHGIYYNIKISSSHRDLAVIREADKGYRNFPSIIAEIEKQNPDRQIFVTSPDQYYLHAASQMGYKAIFDYAKLLPDLKVTSKSLLIIPVHNEELTIMKEYIERRKPRLLLTVAGTYFYADEINPE